jgi:hypothetical protein
MSDPHIMLSLNLDTRPPPTRADCSSIPRPCPRTACKYNLTGLTRGGGLPSPTGLAATNCVLDVVDAHPDGIDQDTLAAAFGYTKIWVRAIEYRGLKALREQLGVT